MKDKGMDENRCEGSEHREPTAPSVARFIDLNALTEEQRDELEESLADAALAAYEAAPSGEGVSGALGFAGYTIMNVLRGMAPGDALAQAMPHGHYGKARKHGLVPRPEQWGIQPDADAPGVYLAYGTAKQRDECVRALTHRAAPPTGRMELREGSNTDPQQPDSERLHEAEMLLPYTWRSLPDFERVLHDIAAALPPSPAAVVDYTERARACIDRYQLPNDKLWHEAVERVAAALSAVASERDAAAIRAFGKRVWSDGEEVAYQAGVSDTRARLREPDVRRAVEAAINEQRALEAGGCFNPSDDTQGECADGDCYCTKQVAREAAAAINALDAKLGEAK